MRKPFPLRRAEARAAFRGSPADSASPDPRGATATSPRFVDDVRDAEEGQIARINDLTRAGRANWFGLLAYLAFTLVTVLGVQDADFFIDSHQTQLPLIGVAIPTFAFFTFAPILGAALHVYLHLLIRKSTEALSQPAAVINGRPLETHVLPWLLNDLVLRMRRDGAAARRPLDWIAGVTAMFLIWFAAPYVLGLMWVRSLPAHDEGLSLLIALCLGFTIYTSLQSWVKMRADLGRPWLARPPVSIAVFGVAMAGWLTLSLGTVLLTEGGLDRLTGEDRPSWADWTGIAPAMAALSQAALPGWAQDDRLLVRADLSGVAFVTIPPELEDHDTAKAAFDAEWCTQRQLPILLCSQEDGFDEKILELQSDWCAEHLLRHSQDCRNYFIRLSATLRNDWLAARERFVSAIGDVDLTGRDLRKADLTRARLSGATLRNVDLQGADLRWSLLESADFFEARLDAADFGQAQLQNASFIQARLPNARLRFAEASGADLRNAIATGANFGDSDLTRADLSRINANGARFYSAQLESANLGSAWLVGANLSYARLVRASLSSANLAGARLENADLTRAYLSHADLKGASLRGALAENATFDSADLDGADLAWGRFQGARFIDARLTVSNLMHSQWRGARLDRAALSAAPAHFADFRGLQGWEPEQFSQLIGNGRTLLPETQPGSEPPRICTCWAYTAPTPRGVTRDPPSHWFCNSPVKTGTPWPLDVNPPWENDNDEAVLWADATTGEPCVPQQATDHSAK